MFNRVVQFFLDHTLLTVLLGLGLLAWGLAVAPFEWAPTGWPRDPIAVDAIPDLGENQQIVVAEWPGRSPQDLEDQVTYPLTTALLGVPGVQTIRSTTLFGVASLYLIFKEGEDFYDARSRVLEKLSALSGALPEGVQPVLGPDATALGQVFWYTLEGRDANGRPTGGWNPQDLRSIQDYYVGPALAAADGVAEVASIGGYVKEYQVELDPHSLHRYGIALPQVMAAVRHSNQDVGAGTLEVNRVEYLIRGLGTVKSAQDLEETLVVNYEGVPVRLGDIARVQVGPAPRRGGLDKAGAEAVGGVVVARFGANPLEVIEAVKERMVELGPGLPKTTLQDGSVSQVTLVPFYDRTQLIYETIGTLEQALTLEVLITLLVVLVLVMNVRASLLISGMLPLGVLVAFIAMRYWGVQANIVALTGIAIAIGVMVDVSVVFTESILRVREEQAQDSLRGIILLAMREVGPAVITALATTVVSFIPVLLLEGQEGKLFRPLAYTKTFALVAALGLGLVLLPTLFYLLWRKPKSPQLTQYARASAVVLLAGVLSYFQQWGFVLFLGGALVLILIASRLPAVIQRYVRLTGWLLGLSWLVWMLARAWLPLGAQVSLLGNMVFTALLVGGILGLSAGFVRVYPQILRWCLRHKGVFLLVPALVMVWGLLAWQGFRVGPDSWRDSFLAQAFPGLGSEFMPTLDEGAFLYMPTTMPHSGVEENLRAIRSIDRRLAAIPEVEVTVGKWGRVNSALDPAPISMFETVIQYTPEYSTDARGRRIRYAVDDDGNYLLKEGGSYPAQAATAPNPEELVEDSEGKYLRLWRPQIQSPDDIWAEVMQVAQWPGLTSAPKLQPIATRLVMLQTGMRSPFGVKVFAPNLEVLSQTLKELEGHLKEVPGIKPETVFADQVVGKPYLEIEWDRFALARYGLTIAEAQAFLAGAIGGQPITYSVEGRERYAVRVRYARDFREDPAQLKESLVSVPVGGQVALSELAEVRFVRGPQSLRSEDTFLVGYVLFDKQPSLAEGEVVLQAEYHLQALQAQGVWAVPTGVRYSFAGTYQQQVRANQRLAVIIPICLVVIFLILYLQFRSATVSAMVFGGIAVAFAGGFVALWAYGRPGFLDLNVVGISLREVFQIHPVNLSVAVWVGFIALFGIATDDGVLMATQLRRRFQSATMDSPEEIRAAVVEAGTRRIRPAMMTTTTTLIALLPVLTSPGRGAEIMVPMAIPTFGGMVFQVMTVFIVPVLFAGWQEARLWMQNRKGS